MSKRDLDSFLESSTGGVGPAGQSRCQTCLRFAHLDSDIRDFLSRKERGEIHIPVSSGVGHKSLWSYLRMRGYDLSTYSLVRHISLCLGINHKTGRALSDEAT